MDSAAGALGVLGARAAPHSSQYRCPGGFEVPQPGQRISTARDALHPPQNFACSRFSNPQRGQFISIPSRSLRAASYTESGGEGEAFRPVMAPAPDALRLELD